MGTGCDTADGGDDALVEPDIEGVGWELNLHTANLSESERSQHIVAENRKYLKHGEWQLSPALKAKLEKHTQPQLQPRHRLQPSCKMCNKCVLCMEGAPGYYKSLEEAVYKKHIVRKKIEDFNPPIPAEGVHKMAKYAYAITYVEDNQADVLPVNFETAMSRHNSLSKSAASLPPAAKVLQKTDSGSEKRFLEYPRD